MRFLWILGLLVAACTRTPVPGRTPKETARELEAALRASNLGAACGLLTADARGRVAAFCMALPASGGTTMEERLEDAGERTRKDADDPLASLQIVVGRVKEYGDRATVEGTLMVQGRARDLALPMAKQGGRWYVDDAELLLRLPVAFAAPQECSAPEG